jgi:hypothetical protein
VVNISELLKLLKKDTVIIKFKHWKTDEELNVVATLNESVTEVKLKQDSSSNVIVVYDVLGEKWEDIRVETILGYSSLEKITLEGVEKSTPED